MTDLASADTWLPLAAALAVAAPIGGALASSVGPGGRNPRPLAAGAATVSLAAAVVGALAWATGDGTPVALGPQIGGGSLVFIDGLWAVFTPATALVATSILLVAPRRSLDAAAVRRALAGLATTLALFSTAHPALLVALWIATARPTWRSARETPGGARAARVYAIYASAGVVCMAAGTLLLVVDPPWERSSGLLGTVGGWLVALAVMIRKGIFPFHSWYPALFEGAPMSTALLATMPQVASYTAVRLLVGHADGVPHELEMLSAFALFTAAYGAALAIVQRDLRGFIGMLAMSQSALVLAGLAATVPMELTGALCLWLSSGLAISGIGLVCWAIESRAGPIALDTLQGRFWDAPALAGFFLLFGMAAIGLPGTLSFIADDLIVSGSLDDHLGAGLLVIASTVLSGIAVMRCWFHVFGGRPEPDSPRHAILVREQVPLTALVVVLFALGLWPGPLVRSLERAAGSVLRGGDRPPSSSPAAEARGGS